LRDENELSRIRDSIDNNPVASANDPDNPERAGLLRR
jgi:hypothetical protein